jgi:starvation-inducible DNA-binding protein
MSNPDTIPVPSPLVRALTTVLADTCALATKTQAAHWNVRGPWFFRLHPVFDTQHDELLAGADVIAERIRALGENTPVSIAQLARLTTLGEQSQVDGASMVRALCADHRALAITCADAARSANATQDQVTRDLLGERIRMHDHTAWMLGSSLDD